MQKTICSIILVLILTGCATEKIMRATGGSKADGTVNLSYEHGLFEKPKIDYELARQTALKRCVAWGYKNANAFDAGVADCVARNAYGNCIRQRVTVSYQCVD